MQPSREARRIFRNGGNILSTPQLYFIRHGETAWSLSGQHTGQTDIPLTAHGEDQAKGLAPLLEHVEFAHVFTSPRQRARRTCELAGLGSAAEIEPDLAEWDYGEYEGRRSLDIREERPGWNIFKDGCPGGETPQEITDRADRLISKLVALDVNTAVFSHGHFGCVLAARWVQLPVLHGQHFRLNTASISILSYNLSQPDVRVIALWNFTEII